MKNVLIHCLRMLAVIAICVLLFVLWAKLKNTPLPGDAEFLFVGTENDADASCLISNDSCVVIDTGEAVDAPHLIQVLKDRDIQKIDCLILTHPDQDHVGGASALLEEFPVTQIITPYYVGEKEAFNALMNQAQSMQIPVTTLSRDREYIFGALRLQIFPPEQFYYNDSNDYSLGILVKHGDVTLFLAGDAEKKRMNELLQLKLPDSVDLYKVAHHGRNLDEGVQMIEQLCPRNAIVTAAYAEDEISQALQNADSTVYSAYQQDVFFTSDQKELTLEAVIPF